jgi:hypothetical protein
MQVPAMQTIGEKIPVLARPRDGNTCATETASCMLKRDENKRVDGVQSTRVIEGFPW